LKCGTGAVVDFGEQEFQMDGAATGEASGHNSSNVFIVLHVVGLSSQTNKQKSAATT